MRKIPSTPGAANIIATVMLLFLLCIGGLGLLTVFVNALFRPF